jgi:O-antigen/teichoic acid export membrane protein
MPYTLSLFLFQFYSRIDVVLLGFLLDTAAVGVYNVAYRVVFLLMFIPHFASVAVLPLASSLFLDSREEFRILYRKVLNAVILVGLPIAAGLWLTAPDLVGLFFGDAFEESASVLRLLSVLLFLTCLDRIMGTFLVACDRQVDRTKSQSVVACVSLVLNLLLIPILGVRGAAIAILVSETVLVILYSVRLKPVLGWPQVGSRLIIGSVAVSSFILPFVITYRPSLFITIPVSVILYAGTLVLFKQTRRNEVRMFISLIKDS